jgi:hypothetical protein
MAASIQSTHEAPATEGPNQGALPPASKALGPRGIREKIMRLRDGGLYAIPVRVDWNLKTSKKESKFPCTWGQIIDPQSWYESINAALLQQADANGVAILTGPSGLYTIDVDIDANNPKKLPGIDLWNRLINIHGKPDTLRARTASGGLHYLFRSNSPGLSSKKNFATVKDGKYTYGIDARCWGGCIFAEPTSYVKEGQVVAYEWLNGPPSYEACKEIPGWLIDLVNNCLVGRESKQRYQTLHDMCSERQFRFYTT